MDRKDLANHPEALDLIRMMIDEEKEDEQRQKPSEINLENKNHS